MYFNFFYYKSNLKNNSICELMISINQTMQPPINLYYSLTNFYLNQRDLVRSRSYPQLRAEVDKRNLSRCDGAKFISEIFDSNKNFTNMWNNTLGPDAMANPCGLQAKAFFTGIEFYIIIRCIHHIRLFKKTNFHKWNINF